MIGLRDRRIEGEEEDDAMDRVLIVAGSRLFADLVSTVLGESADTTEIRDASAVEEYIARGDGWDTVVFAYDVLQPPELDTVRALRQCWDVAVVIVGIPDDAHLILSYLEAGCTGYVRSTDSLERLRQVLQCGNGDETVIDSHIAATMLRRLHALRQQAQSHHRAYDAFRHDEGQLSKREREVVQLVAAGLTNQEIADRLFIAVGTAKNHVHNVLRKLELRDRREVIQYLQATGNTAPPGEARPERVARVH